MTYRIPADENVEQATVNYLRKLGHDVACLDAVDELGLGAADESIVHYANETNRLILTQDDDFFTAFEVENTPGVLFQRDQTLSARQVGDIVHELAQYLDQSEIRLEYVSENWL